MTKLPPRAAPLNSPNCPDRPRPPGGSVGIPRQRHLACQARGLSRSGTTQRISFLIKGMSARQESALTLRHPYVPRQSGCVLRKNAQELAASARTPPCRRYPAPATVRLQFLGVILPYATSFHSRNYHRRHAESSVRRLPGIRCLLEPSRNG